MATMKPGDWITTLFGYDDIENPFALVVATSRHKRRMTRGEIDAKISGLSYARSVIWWASTKQHRENDACDCEEGAFCEDGGGVGWVEVVICSEGNG